MTVSGGSHGDAGREIKKFVAVDVSYNYAPALFRYEWIGAGIGRRNVAVVAFENALGDRAGQSSLDFWPVNLWPVNLWHVNHGRWFSGHWILLKVVVGGASLGGWPETRAVWAEYGHTQTEEDWISRCRKG
jgi:hypothetical protein